MNHKTLHHDGIVTRLHPCLHLDGHQSCQIWTDDGTGLCKNGIMAGKNCDEIFSENSFRRFCLSHVCLQQESL